MSAVGAEEPDSAAADDQKINRPILALFIVTGLLALYLGWSTSYDLTIFRGEHAAFWSGLFVNVGTTLLLAAALVWFERALLTRVQSQNGAAIERAADQAAERASEQTAGLIKVRLDDLEARMHATAEARAEERWSSARNLSDRPDFEATKRAFQEATSINAVQTVAIPGIEERLGEVVVPAGEGPDAPRLHVLLRPGSSSRSDLIVFRHGADDVAWKAGVDADVPLGELREAMIAAGHSTKARLFSARVLFQNLSLLLADAVAARQGEQDAWLSGDPVIELVRDGWVITSAGIEVQGVGLATLREEFGENLSSAHHVATPKVTQDAPSGLDQETWTEARKLAAHRFRDEPHPGILRHSPPPRWWSL